MSDIKIGDKVYLRKDLKMNDVYDGLRVLSCMVVNAKNSEIFTVDEECLCGQFHITDDRDASINWYVTKDMITKEKGEKKMKEFTKADLKDGMVVEMRKYGRFLVLAGGLINRVVSFNLNHMYREDLTDNSYDTDYDIMKVFEPKSLSYPGNLYEVRDFVEDKSKFKLVWERKEITISEEGKKYLELLLAKGYEWLARDNEGDTKKLYMYPDKPAKGVLTDKWSESEWSGPCEYVPNSFDEFDFVKVEDKEPWNIKEILEICEEEE